MGELEYYPKLPLVINFYIGANRFSDLLDRTLLLVALLATILEVHDAISALAKKV